MTRNPVRSLTLATLVALAVPSVPGAQTTPAPATLASGDIQQLIARGQPADHARLSAHFASLANRYEAEARRHAGMQPAFTGNAKLSHLATSQAAHCKQLAATNQESARILRDLAAHHATQATGAASQPPAGSDRFQGATRVPSDAELNKLAATASTAADHGTLASYFTALVTQYEREAKESAAYAASWRAQTRVPSAASLAARWEQLAKQQGAAAAEARAAAAAHRDHVKAAK